MDGRTSSFGGRPAGGVPPAARVAPADPAPSRVADLTRYRLGSAEAAPAGPLVDLASTGRILFNRKWLVLAVVALATAAAIVVVQRLQPIYGARALVMLDPREDIYDADSLLTGLPLDSALIEGEIQVIRSRLMAERAVASLNLMTDPEFNPALRPAQPGLLERLDPRPWLRGHLPAGVVDVLGLTAEPPDVVTPLEERLEEQRRVVINNFLQRLSVSRQGSAQVIAVGFRSGSPQKAALIANTVADLYIVEQLEARFETTRRVTAWLNERLGDLARQVRLSEEAVERYRVDNALIAESEADVAINAQQLSELNTALVMARAERTEAEARVARIGELVDQGQALDTIPEVTASPLIVGLRQQLAALAETEAELRAQYGDQHPRMLEISAQRRDLTVNLQQEIARIVDALENELMVATAREQALAQSIPRLVDEAAEINQAEVGLRELEREVEASRQLYDAFLTRFTEVSDEEEIRQPNARVISPAVIPEAPYYPRKSLLVAAAFAVSVVLGAGMALGLEATHKGFRSREQLEQALGVANLGVAQDTRSTIARRVRPEDVVIGKPMSSYAEAIRGVRISLYLSNVDRPPKVVLVTSALPGEGKTVLSISLARSAAAAGQRVVLIDGDLRRPSIHRVIRRATQPGLIEFLAEEVKLSDVVVADAFSDLKLIPVYHGTPNPKDLLGSNHMRQLLNTLRAHYDLIVIDSAPVLAVADSRILANLADKVLLAVQWEKTPRKAAREAMRYLMDADADMAGTVMTRTDWRRYRKYGRVDGSDHYHRIAGYYTN